LMYIAMLGSEPGASNMLDKGSTMELHPSLCFCIIVFLFLNSSQITSQIGVCHLLPTRTWLIQVRNAGWE
jgi:hypothetical protein